MSVLNPDDSTGFVLAIETSGVAGSVALGRGGDVIEVRAFQTARRHAVDLWPTIDALCNAHGIAPEQVRTVFVSSGPGSFTGLRIGITAARAIAFATGARVVAVPTLEVIAQNALEADDPPASVVVMLDAKRNHVYAAAFARQGVGYVPLGEPVEADPVEFLNTQSEGSLVIGEGAQVYADRIANLPCQIAPEHLHAPRAEVVYRLGFAFAQLNQFVEPRMLVPLYIRPPEPEEKFRC